MTLPAKMYLSPADLAETLGLSVSTLKRWTDRGILKVERTAGGHRRIAVTEALRFVRDSGLKPVMPHRLGLPGPDGDGTRTGPELAALLTSCRTEEARRMLVSAFVSGESIVTIADTWIRPAFERVGELWRHGNDGIAFEHQATEAVLRAVAEMRALVPGDPDGAAAVGGAVAGDPYQLPSALAALVLAVNRFQPTNLGGELPRGAILACAERVRPRIVWLSISVPNLDEGRRPALEDLAGKLAALGAAVAIGGRCAPERVAGATVCRDMAELATFAQGVRA